jgi:rare lipoprotein A
MVVRPAPELKTPSPVVVDRGAVERAAVESHDGLKPEVVKPEVVKPVAPSKPGVPEPTSRIGGYYGDDGPPDRRPAEFVSAPDAEPRAEPLMARANRSYVVFGKTYQPMTARTVFKERGIGSWYGKKFHGKKTSTGEIYDMYAMSAAHPTLPLPSYVRVTHLKSQRSVVVRVNDRGPFLHNRIIDLSYAAASKLGYINQGSAELEVELIQPGEKTAALKAPAPASLPTLAPAPAIPEQLIMTAVVSPTLSPQAPPTPESLVVETRFAPVPLAAQSTSVEPKKGVLYLQLGAFSSRPNADIARQKLALQLDWLAPTMRISQEQQLYKVQAGPYVERQTALDSADRVLQATGYKPFVSADPATLPSTAPK